MCAEKAKFFHRALGLEGSFCASSGRFTRFKQRYGIHKIAVQGECLSADTTAASEFKQQFQKIVSEEQLSLEQIYNADETGLYWKCLSSRTLVHEAEHAPGHKSSKARVRKSGTLCPCSVTKLLPLLSPTTSV